RAFEAGDLTLWALEDQCRAMEKAAYAGAVVSLLPAFDSFVLGYADRGLLVPGKYRKVVYHGGQTVPVVLVNGVAAGVWRYERKGKKLAVKISPFEPFDRTTGERADEEAEDVGRFFGLPATIVRD
ncbi:MAG: hypothetical protein EHM35_09360, partial [Planctomycetaceae bacterium]